MNTTIITPPKGNWGKRYNRYYTWIGPLMSKPQARAYTFLILSLFTIAFFIFFAIRPTVNTIINLQKQIEDNKVVDKKLQDKINALSQVQAELDIIQPDLKVLDGALPERANLVELVKMMEGVATSQQASLSAMQIGDVELSSNLNQENLTTTVYNATASSQPKIFTKPITVLLTTEGDYVKIAGVIKNLTKLSRLVTLDSASITKNGGKIFSVIRLNGYYLTDVDPSK